MWVDLGDLDPLVLWYPFTKQHLEQDCRLDRTVSTVGGAMRRKWCNRCQGEGHLKRDCPRGRLRVVTDPESQPVTESETSDPWDLSSQPRIQEPGLSGAYAYWDTSAPLVSIYEAWDGPGAESPARIARDVRLRTEAARQVAESRAARGVL